MIGTTIAHYKVVSKLGEGGMGEVYRASDTKLNRDVALKILPEKFAADTQRMGRFQREAEVLASLSHPNIGQIYGIEDAGDTKALVLELIEGPTLAERIGRGALPLEEAMQIALQICEALEAAHYKGIVHRDLKPANIKLTPEGGVKVLDFGLARAMESEAEPGDLTQSPTLSMAATQAGMILGTAGYMSPEQAQGQQADTRADVWALGVVLFEMLAGRPAFEGENASLVLAHVLSHDPQWEALPAGVPERVRDLLERSLRKDPRQRVQAVGDLRIAIEEALSDPPGDRATAASLLEARPVWLRVLPWSIAALAVVSAAFLWFRSPGPEKPLRKLAIAGSEGATYPVISPDGARIAYRRGGSLSVRALDQLTDHPVAGTTGVPRCRWSPDSRSLTYAFSGSIWKVNVDSGNSSIVCAIPGGNIYGLDWADDGYIYFPTSDRLWRVVETGGDPVLLTELDPNQQRFLNIEILPGNRGLLFGAMGGNTLYRFSGGEIEPILTLKGALIEAPTYSPTGHVLYVRAQTNPGLYAVPFSLDTLEVTGDAVLVAGKAQLPSVSDDGTLVYAQGGSGASIRQLAWVSRKGELLETIGVPQNGLGAPALSPDETEVAVNAEESGGAEIWRHDIARATATRVTFAGQADFPFWHPDGETIFYTYGFRGSKETIRRTRADGSSEPEEVVAGFSADVSSDGETLVFVRDVGAGPPDIFSASLQSPAEDVAFAETAARELDPSLSPDGRWLAYSSDEAGLRHIYLRRFPPAEGKWQASAAESSSPVWSRAGDELFFWSGNDLMAVSVKAAENTLTLGRPIRLFSNQPLNLRIGRNFDVSRDGQRFLMVLTSARSDSSLEAGPQPIVMVENWFREFETAGH